MTNTRQEGNTVRNYLKLTVSLNVLQEACRRLSGVAHRYSVEASRNRVYLTYSNPNEYGSEFPMTAVMPAWQESWPKPYTVVCCEILRVKNDNWDGEGWQAFGPVFDLARRLLPLAGGPVAGGWSELSEDVAKEYHRSQAGFTSQGLEAVFAKAREVNREGMDSLPSDSVEHHRRTASLDAIDFVELEAERRGLYIRESEYQRRGQEDRG